MRISQPNTDTQTLYHTIKPIVRAIATEMAITREIPTYCQNFANAHTWIDLEHAHTGLNYTLALAQTKRRHHVRGDG